MTAPETRYDPWPLESQARPFGIIRTVTSADGEGERLTALGGLAALSLDALSSVAYGPEAILVVLVAAGAAGLRYSLSVTIAIVVLLAALVISYRQVIQAFPNGGGAYAVSQRHLGRSPHWSRRRR
jgi:amino acid transporter